MSGFSSEEQITEKRWDPIGAPNEKCSSTLQNNEQDEVDKLKLLEKDKEVLSSSLFALTSHFAQVQLRLRQVIYAPPESRENLLESLEEFACQGIPVVGMLKEKRDESTLMTEIYLRRQQQKEVLSVLKKQLMDLKKYAFQNKDVYRNDDIIIQRHKVIMNELKTKINLNINEEELVVMDPETISKEITSAVDQLISPVRINEHLVCQLKAQIADLEQFIEYLQIEMKSQNCLKQHTNPGLIHKFMNAFEIVATLQLCAYKFSQKNDSNYDMKEKQEYIDMQKKLESCVFKVRQLIQNEIRNRGNRVKINHNSLTRVIRKTFSTILRHLIEHGTCTPTKLFLVPFTICCLYKSFSPNNPLHAWDIVLKYYTMENGESLMSPTNLLQSFSLEYTNPSEISPTEELLWGIKSVISMHEPYKKDKNSQFKAFICLALNHAKLASWIRLIFSNIELVKECYQPWSYVAVTGFQDSLRILDSLSEYEFDLPVDKAVRHFRNIKDVFY